MSAPGPGLAGALPPAAREEDAASDPGAGRDRGRPDGGSVAGGRAAGGWLEAPVECGPSAGFGVYLHVPFCSHRCGYCDFATVGLDDGEGDRAWVPRYVAALQDDLGRTVAAGQAGGAPPQPGGSRSRRPPARPDWPAVTSIYVGGGTPTLLPAADLAAMVGAVHRELDVVDAVEVTVECNPENASEELFAALAAAGVTRISLGAQSFAPRVLRVLERQHDPQRTTAAVAAARRAGIPHVNLDLIYGTPGETAHDWRAGLAAATATGADHLSCYALTVHEGTPLGRRVAAGVVTAPDPDVQRDRFDTARDVLAGFDHYELSSWARTPADRCRHNVLYWRHGDYLGVGVGAHGHVRGRRWWSYRSIRRYLDAVGAGRAPTSDSEVLSVTERATERLLLGLRLASGIPASDLPPLDSKLVRGAVAAGLVTTSGGRLAATREGWFLVDEAVRRLL